MNPPPRYSGSSSNAAWRETGKNEAPLENEEGHAQDAISMNAIFMKKARMKKSPIRASPLKRKRPE